jgi:hypothetical protein
MKLFIAGFYNDRHYDFYVMFYFCSYTMNDDLRTFIELLLFGTHVYC